MLRPPGGDPVSEDSAAKCPSSMRSVVSAALFDRRIKAAKPLTSSRSFSGMGNRFEIRQLPAKLPARLLSCKGTA